MITKSTFILNKMINKRIFCILLLTVCIFTSCMQKQEKKPNVIYILTDQWRASALGYEGNDEVKTPSLDAFAKASINFKNAVTVTPVCTPYRAALLTGKYPTSTGMFFNDIYLPKEELTMAEIYKSAGYKTAFLGKWHLDGHGRKSFVAPDRRQGFEFWMGAECDHDYNNGHYYENDDPHMKHWKGYSTYAISEEAQNYMESASKKEDPFLLFVSISTPHFPHNTAPREMMDVYAKDSLTLPNNVTDDMKSWALKELEGYYAHCSATDKAIGEIIKKTKELGIYDNSIIVFTADHGEMMGSHGYRPFMKHQPYAESANIPFLISYPGIEDNQGKTADAPITTPDILPSMLALSHIKIPESIEGYNLSEIMKNPEIHSKRAALYMDVCPFGIAYNSDAYRAIKTSQYTFVKTPKGPTMLFDDIHDSLQMNNLIEKPEYSKIRKELDQQLMSELSRIGETEVKPRTYYKKKFCFEGKEQFREDDAIKDYYHVDEVVSPKK
jgi:arylsulfatase A-like enzyme